MIPHVDLRLNFPIFRRVDPGVPVVSIDANSKYETAYVLQGLTSCNSSVSGCRHTLGITWHLRKAHARPLLPHCGIFSRGFCPG
jgi:hypothetical protein